MKLRFILILLSFIFTYKTVYSQGFTWNVYTKKDGFQDQAVITEIIQDKKGFLWMNNSEKISRFDGVNFANFYDKSNRIAFHSFKNLISTSDGNIVSENSNNYCELNPGLGNYTYQPVDSGLTYKYFPEIDAYMSFDSYINKNLYAVYSKDHSKKTKFCSDTVFYIHKGITKWCLLEKKNLIRSANCLTQDKDKNIYMYLNDTLAKKTHYFLFNDGKMEKLFITNIYNNDAAKIIKDKDNQYWIFSDNKAQCYNSQKLLKEYILYGVDSELGYFSQPLLDSRNNVWISYPEELIKVNLKGIEKFRDKNRRVPEIIQASFDRNGNEMRGSIKNYNNFFNAFAIDNFDNIISGERIFDGHQFTDVSANKNFKDAFDNIKKENLPSLYTCFVDKENNIWYGSSLGLIKASPIPFKATDTRFSYKEEDFELRYTDIQSRNYFQKIDASKNEVILHVFKDDSLQFSKSFKTFQNYYEIYYVSLNKGVLWRYKGADEIDKLTFFDGIKETSIKAKNKTDFFTLVSKNNDTAIYKVAEELVLFTNGVFKKINFSSRGMWYETIRFRNSTKIILSDFTEIIIKPDLTLDSINFLGLKGKNCKIIGEQGTEENYLVMTPKKEFFLLNTRFTLTKLSNNIPDSVFRNILGFSHLFNDLLIANTRKDGFLLFKINKTNKSISFLRNLVWEDGLLNSRDDAFYYLNGYVIQSHEKQDVFRIMKFEDFTNGDLKNGLTFENNKIILSGKISKNKFNDSIISGYITYLGKRGINLTKPTVHINSIAFVSSGILEEFTSEYKGKINIPFNSNFFIDFKGICLTDGKKLKYKYKLLGLDKDWQDEQDYNATDVKYQTLSPGTYTFQVIACNNNGIWNDTPAEISFTVLAPWYRTWWAYSSYGIIGFASIFGFVKNRTRKLEKEKEKLEKVVEERTAEVVKQKHLLEEKNKEVMDSITYARRIQQSLMPTEKYISRILGKKK